MRRCSPFLVLLLLTLSGAPVAAQSSSPKQPAAKSEANKSPHVVARLSYYSVNDFEFGVEWQPSANFELVIAYYSGDRRFEDKQLPSNVQRGNLLSIQSQVNC